MAYCCQEWPGKSLVVLRSWWQLVKCSWANLAGSYSWKSQPAPPAPTPGKAFQFLPPFARSATPLIHWRVVSPKAVENIFISLYWFCRLTLLWILLLILWLKLPWGGCVWCGNRGVLGCVKEPQYLSKHSISITLNKMSLGGTTFASAKHSWLLPLPLTEAL